MLLNKTLINTRCYTTFQRLGISDTVTNQLKTNFGIKQATQAQCEFIPAILSGKDLFLRDATGTGKTFGMVLTLASQSSCRSLYITPNQELASQINQWIQRLQSSSSSGHHIIVDTPARLLQRVTDPAQQHEFKNISRIILDEADQALRLPKRYATLRQQQYRKDHPKPAQLVMTSLFNHLKHKKPQLIVSSATLNRNLRYWMTQQGWMYDPLFIDITKGNQIPHHHKTNTIDNHLQPLESTSNIPPVQHYCLMVSDDAIRNMTPAFTTDNNTKYSSLVESMSNTSSPKTTSFEDDDDRMLESIGILHGLETNELQNSVLFVDTSVSTADIQERLASYNIHARDIREAIDEQQQNNNNNNKTLWIATEFTARGVDLPHISHVFILGKPSSIASYIHMAGRTGRLGVDGNMGRGKVISLVRDHGKSEAKMINMYNLMNIPIRLLEHVE